jgi:hypothetical protein
MEWVEGFYSRTGVWWGRAESAITRRDTDRLPILARNHHTASHPLRILDFGSSYGSTPLVMAQAGHDVTGVEISDRITFAETIAPPTAGSPRFVRGDFYAFTDAERFDVVTHWNGFGSAVMPPSDDSCAGWPTTGCARMASPWSMSSIRSDATCGQVTRRSARHPRCRISLLRARTDRFRPDWQSLPRHRVGSRQAGDADHPEPPLLCARRSPASARRHRNAPARHRCRRRIVLGRTGNIGPPALAAPRISCRPDARHPPNHSR